MKCRRRPRAGKIKNLSTWPYGINNERQPYFVKYKVNMEKYEKKHINPFSLLHFSIVHYSHIVLTWCMLWPFIEENVLQKNKSVCALLLIVIFHYYCSPFSCLFPLKTSCLLCIKSCMYEMNENILLSRRKRF